jgi:hypothetical protein
MRFLYRAAMPRTERSCVVTLSAFLSMLAVGSGCQTVPAADHAGKDAAKSSPDADATLAPRATRELQSAAMEMADDYTAALTEAMDRAAQNAGIRSRAAAQTMLRSGTGSAFSIAAGPNPGVAVLDLLVLSSLQCWSLRGNPAGIGFDGADAGRALPRLEAGRDALWTRAGTVLSETELAQLRLLIESWVKSNPDQTMVAFVRLDDFTDARNNLPSTERARASGLLKEVDGLTSALDDARLLGERSLWFLSRFPSVLGQQAEMTAYRIVDALEVDEQRVREAISARVAKERSAFGEILAAERKALAAAATTERKALSGALGEERTALADALAKERAALAAALGKEREAVFADVARERAAILEGVSKEVADTLASVKAERESLAKWAGEERVALADDLEARIVKLIDRALYGAGLVAGGLLVGLVVLRFIPQRKAG